MSIKILTELEEYQQALEYWNARTLASEAQLVEALAVLRQAQACIMHETPEDMTPGEAEDDTLSKIRALFVGRMKA